MSNRCRSLAFFDVGQLQCKVLSLLSNNAVTVAMMKEKANSKSVENIAIDAVESQLTISLNYTHLTGVPADAKVLSRDRAISDLDPRPSDASPDPGFPSTADSFSDLPTMTQMLTPHHQSMVGGLSSACLHMLLLIILGLLFAPAYPKGAIDIELAMANTSASAEMESFTISPLDAALHNPAVSKTTTANAPRVDVLIEEPQLIMDLGDVVAGEALADPTALLSDAIESPGGTTGTAESGKKGTFFGANAYGDDFVYVVDMSTSMGYRSEYGQTRFAVACRELLRSINELTSKQKFCVFMFSYRTRVMFDMPPRMIRATDSNKRRIALWINSLGLGGGTDPRFGTMMALKLKPDAIFLLSDGEFNGREVNTHGIPGNPPIETIIKQMRKGAVPIHTIAFEDLGNRKRLRRIANATNGTHRFIGNVSDQELLIDDLRSHSASDVAIGLQGLIDGTSKVRDDRTLVRAVHLITARFTSEDKKLRTRAYHAMLTLANGDDMGPGEDASADEFAAAKRAWHDYWRDHFRRKRTGELESDPDSELAEPELREPDVVMR